eukprot:gene11814-35301_t
MLQGVPTYMIEKARVLLGDAASEEELTEFILNNADQPDAFWGVTASSATVAQPLLSAPNRPVRAQSAPDSLAMYSYRTLDDASAAAAGEVLDDTPSMAALTSAPAAINQSTSASASKPETVPEATSADVAGGKQSGEGGEERKGLPIQEEMFRSLESATAVATAALLGDAAAGGSTVPTAGPAFVSLLREGDMVEVNIQCAEEQSLWQTHKLVRDNRKRCGACCHDNVCTPHWIDNAATAAAAAGRAGGWNGRAARRFHGVGRFGGRRGGRHGARGDNDADSEARKPRKMDATCYAATQCKGLQCYSVACRAKYAAEQPTCFKAATGRGGGEGAVEAAEAAAPFWVQARVVAVVSRLTDKAAAANIAKAKIKEAAKRKAEQIAQTKAAADGGGSADAGAGGTSAGRSIDGGRTGSGSGAAAAAAAGMDYDEQPINFRDAPPMIPSSSAAAPTLQRQQSSNGWNTAATNTTMASKAEKEAAKKLAKIKRELANGKRVLAVRVAIESRFMPDNFNLDYVRTGGHPLANFGDQNPDGDDELFFWVRKDSASYVRAVGTATDAVTDWQWRVPIGHHVAVSCQTVSYIRIHDQKQQLRVGDSSASASWFEGTIVARHKWLGAKDQVLVVAVPNELVNAENELNLYEDSSDYRRIIMYGFDRKRLSFTEEIIDGLEDAINTKIELIIVAALKKHRMQKRLQRRGVKENGDDYSCDYCKKFHGKYSDIMADFRAYVDGCNTAGMRKLSNEQRLSLMVLREHKVKLAWKCDTTKMFKPKVIKQRRGRDRGRGHGRNIDDAEQTHSSESGIIASASFWPKPVLSYRPHTEDTDGGVNADAGGGGGGAPPIHTSTSATLDWSDAEEDEEEGDEDEEEPKTVFAAVALTQTLLSLQCAAAASVVRDSPDVALNTVVQTVANSGPLQLQAARNSPGRRNFRAPRSRGMFQAGRVGTIVAHIPGRNEFVFMPSVGSKHTHWSTTPEPMLVDLSQFWFTCNPMPQVPLAPMKHLAAVDTKMFECQVCMEYKSADGFMPFCFRHFQITGDGHDMRDPRHPREICGACLRSLAMIPLSEGKLFVRCPAEGCSRSLQTLELKGIVTKGIYKELIDRTRELPAGIELRLCPECYCRIEKNHGCDTMNCYRCGHGFDWNDATLVNVGKIPTTDDTDGEGSQDGASDDSDAHEEGNGGGGGGGGGGGA